MARRDRPQQEKDDPDPVVAPRHGRCQDTGDAHCHDGTDLVVAPDTAVGNDRPDGHHPHENDPGEPARSGLPAEEPGRRGRQALVVDAEERGPPETVEVTHATGPVELRVVGAQHSTQDNSRQERQCEPGCPRPVTSNQRQDDEGERRQLDAGHETGEQTSVAGRDDQSIDDDERHEVPVDLSQDQRAQEGLERRRQHVDREGGNKAEPEPAPHELGGPDEAADASEGEEGARHPQRQGCQRCEHHGSERRVGERQVDRDGRVVRGHLLLVQAATTGDRPAAHEVDVQVDPQCGSHVPPGEHEGRT